MGVQGVEGVEDGVAISTAVDIVGCRCCLLWFLPLMASAVFVFPAACTGLQPSV